VRLCVVGDELVAGAGDPRALGWVGRVVARTPRDDKRVTAFPLAVPGETTTALAARWQSEASLRWAGSQELSPLPFERRLAVGLGVGDLRHGISTARSRLNLANMLDAAEAVGLEALVVGPPPVSGRGPDAAVSGAVGDLSGAFADVCQRRRIRYVDTWSPLEGRDEWFADLAVEGGRYPGQAGYGLLAWLVLHAGWNAWLGVDG
jgi:lysophospholipase L1-like esterase